MNIILIKVLFFFIYIYIYIYMVVDVVSVIVDKIGIMMVWWLVDFKITVVNLGGFILVLVYSSIKENVIELAKER